MDDESRCFLCGLDHWRLGVQIRNGVLRRRAKGSKHLLRMHNGAWGFDIKLFKEHSGDFDQIEVRDVESGNVYIASTQVFEDHAFVKNLGWGPQMILPLEHWRCIRAALKVPA